MPGIIVRLVVAIALISSAAFADAQRIRSENELDDWWAQRAAVFFPKYQFTLASTNPSLPLSGADGRPEKIFSPNSAAPDLYWRTDGTAGTWTGTNWSNPATATGGTGWTSGDDAFFTATSTVTFVSGVLFADITVSAGFTVNVTNAGTAAAGAHVYDIGTGATLNWAGQNFTAAGTSFVKNGDGIWNIGNIANAYDGGFTLNAGTVIVSGDNSLGGASSPLTINGGTIQSSGSRTFAPTSITVGGDFALTGTGNSTWVGNVNLGSATRTITNTAIGNPGITRTFSGIISGDPGTGLTIVGTGTGADATTSITILSGANTYSGGTTLDGGGILRLSKSGTLGDTSGSLTVNAGRLDLNGTSQGVGNLTGSGGTIVNNATGTNELLTIGNGNGTGGNYQGVIADHTGAGMGTLALTKTGSGTITLSGTNTYTGATTINGGVLLVNGSTASGSAVTVTNSGSVLGGSGTVNGTVVINSGAAIRGGTGLVASGSLTLSNNLTLNSGSIIQLALGPSGAHSTLARTGGTWVFDSTQAFTFIDLGAQATTYDNIITGLASDPGSEGAWTITNSGWMGTFTFDGTNIDLTLTVVPEPSTWIGGALALGVLGWSQRKRFGSLVRRTA